MYILGISAFFHDSSAALIDDGVIRAAAQEERFTRKKQDNSFPLNAINYCLDEAEISIDDVSHIAYYEDPFLKYDRLIKTDIAMSPFSRKSFLASIPQYLSKKIWIQEIIQNSLNYNGKIDYTRHHESHSASAYYPSPFDEAVVLTIDGVGEWSTSTIGIGKANSLKLIKELKFPHSLGLLYSAFTYYTGFKVNSGEYKVMGLAPYGEPKYTDIILDKLIDLKEDGSFKINKEYFGYLNGFTMTNRKFNRLFGGEPRKPESQLTQKEMDLARSIQDVTEEIMIRMSDYAHEITGLNNLCLAGGTALNCVGNGKIFKHGTYDDIWIQPASGDAGGSLGAALYVWYNILGNKRSPLKQDSMNGAYLGPSFSNNDIEKYLKSIDATYQQYNDSDLINTVATKIAEGNVIGWFQGRMEYGPRALGARSIIADPRNSEMQKKLNLKIKFRESFRPFAPSVLIDDLQDYFDLDHESPYMLLVSNVNAKICHEMSESEKQLFGIDKLNISRSTIPAVTHVDYSARIQTVHKETNKRYYELIQKFKEITGCSVLVNTSFNVRGEPIVCTPEDAYRCFMRTDMDYLILENFVLDKKDQPKFTDKDWRQEYTLD